jgi:hydrogenase/urease accessory protein HupE
MTAAVTARGAVRAAAATIALGLCLNASVARAHKIDAMSMFLNEVAPGRFLVRWQAGSSALEADLRIPATFPAPCRIEGAYLDCGPTGLAGVIELPWLEGTLTRVMVEIEWLNHTRLLRIVTASAPRLVVYGAPSGVGLRSLAPIAADYTRLGVEHILTGFDHLLFVVALALLVRVGRSLLATVTAFTVAHSLSLAATVLGLVNVPSPPVEAIIALSIVLVCVECLRPADSLARRAPWLVAFAFGLLHGLGFASALLAIGLPQTHVPLALLFFNIGVELGQLAIIAVVTGMGALATRLRLSRPWQRPGVVYVMGSVAAAWSLERLAAIVRR